MIRILLGCSLVLFGTFMTIKSNMFFEFFGAVKFAEKYLHSEGGSRLFYKLFGIGLILLGFVIITNLYGGVIEWIGYNLFGAFIPEPPSTPS